MDILWISGRTLGLDLAGTTEIGIFEAINRKNENQVTIISPGKKKEWGRNHIPIKKINIPGLITISGSIMIRLKLKKILNECKYDVIMVDWRYVRLMRNLLKNTEIPWFIIDRGPPMKQNWRLRFQKYLWKKSWEIANIHASAGIIVSKKHNEFIKKYANTYIDTIIVNSGTSFPYGEIKSLRENNVVEIIYIGQIDKRRDIQSIFKLKEHLDKALIKNRIRIIGEGDARKDLTKRALEIDGLEVLGRKNEKETKFTLSKSLVGILPMPDAPIWQMASTIKLVEYARNGLITVGPKHAGNSWGENPDWEFLSENKKWWIEATTTIKELILSGLWENFSKSAIYDSKERSWDKISDKMILEMRDNMAKI